MSSVSWFASRGACPCGLEDAERYPLETRRTVVPTSVNCPIHNQYHPDYSRHHGTLPAPNPEQLLEPDPERFLAGGPLHDPCAGGDECEGLCTCDGDGE